MIGSDYVNFIEKNALQKYLCTQHDIYIGFKVLVSLKTGWDHIEYKIWNDGTTSITKCRFGKCEKTTEEEALKLRGLA